MQLSRFLYGAALIWSVAAMPSRAASDLVPAGLIEEISGTVRLFTATNKNPEMLDARKDLGRILYSGETLQCDGGSIARIHLTGSKNAPPAVCSKGKYSLPVNLPGKTGTGFLSAENVLEKYKLAGREKGSDTSIYSPPEGGAVIASTLIVRWRTRPPLHAFTAVLHDARGTEIARVDNVDPAPGMLDSSVLRDALAKYNASDAPYRQARLVFQSEAGSENGVSFSVLTKEQERALDSALAEYSATGGLFQHVERAAIYESFRMYNQVAAEYDGALKEAPDSRDLIHAALNAYARVGDLRRARELRDKLREVEGPAEK